MSAFLTCVQQQLEARGFGKKRVDELLQRFDGVRSRYAARGHPAPEGAAAADLFKQLDYETAERKRLAAVTMIRMAEWKARFDAYNRNSNILRAGNSKAKDWSRVALAGLEPDPRSGALSYDNYRSAYRQQLYNLIGEELAEISKGSLGRQRGKSTLNKLVDEIYGVKTGDAAAADVAKGWNKMTAAVPKIFRQAGGAMNTLAGPYLPDPNAAARMIRAKQGPWVKDHLDWIDWGRTLWPDGSLIAPAERQGFLEAVYRTKSSEGANKIDPGSFNGRGAAVGNLLEKHRLLHYKGPDAWKAAHGAYGDGTIFDVMTRYVEDTAHRLALVRTFGPNPRHMLDTIKAMALKRAEAEDAAANAGDGPIEVPSASITETGFQNRVEPLYDVATRANPMDGNSTLANAYLGLSNVLTSAFLGAAVLKAIPGDFATAAIARTWSGQNAFGGMGYYLRQFAGDKGADKRAISAGILLDDFASSLYTMQRFTGVDTYGPHLSKRTADVVLRASLLTAHTRAARKTVRRETYKTLHETRDVPFDKHPLSMVFKRWGIDEESWDAFRQMPPHKDHDGLVTIRALDAIEAYPGKKGQRLYEQWAAMVDAEAEQMVLSSRMRASVMMRGSTRPDTLHGAILHSFAMFKNFPVSLFLTYGQLAMSNPNRMSRVGMLGALGASMTVAGALGVQLSEVASGRDPMDMTDPKFWGKAALSGGALSVFGDFLFAGINRYGSGPEDVTAGPPIMFAGDALQLTIGEGFNWVKYLGGFDDRPDPFAGELVEFTRRYTPGSNLWWGKLALQRGFWDSLQELADPKAYQKWQRQTRNRAKDYGQEYFWAPGQGPERAPNLEAAVGQ